METHLNYRNDVATILALAEMSERAERLRGYDIRLVDSFPSLLDCEDELYLGSFSWTCRKKRYKLLLRDTAIAAFGMFVTPADFARLYIEARYGKPCRITRQQYDAVALVKRSPPLAAKPGWWEEAAYIDLKSAYWQILSIVGWNVDYFPGRWLAAGDLPTDFPLPDHKLARNCLVTVGLAGHVNRWDGHALQQHVKANKLTNNVLWALVMDVLHGVAADMVKVGAVYVHTDGYILPAARIPAAWEVFDAWGLKAGVKMEGPTRIAGVGRYDMANHRDTRPAVLKPKPFIHINQSYTAWLRPRFRRLSELATPLLKH